MTWPFSSRSEIDGEVIYIHTPRPSPMPDVRRAVLYVPDAIQALERARSAWNKTQLLDAIRSAEHFLAAAKDALATDTPTDQGAAGRGGAS